MTLKIQLEQLKDEETVSLSKESLDSLLADMLDQIGHVDPELRDGLIYPTFIKFMNEGILSEHQYLAILKTCLDEWHLFFKIGEKNNDSVFTRSFSSLVLAGLLSIDQSTEWLSEVQLNEICKKSVDYLKREQDTRGHVDEKGWAHSIAHGADLLVSVVNHPQFSKTQFTQVLEALYDCLFKEAVYIDEEDERLIFVIEALMERYLGETQLANWIASLFDGLESIQKREGYSNNYFRKKFTITTFLKSLYFRIGFLHEQSGIRELIHQRLKNLHHNGTE